MITSAPPFISGQLLLALPGIGDPRFERSVIAMCLHDAEGAMGVAIHQPHPRVQLGDVLHEVGLETAHSAVAASAVFVGGPVEPGRGFVLHSADYGSGGTIAIGSQWAMTGTRDILEAIAEGRGPARWLVALGYAGWVKGQLEGELHQHGWMTAPATDALLYDLPPEHRWAAAYAGLGVDVSHLSAQGGHA